MSRGRTQGGRSSRTLTLELRYIRTMDIEEGILGFINRKVEIREEIPFCCSVV